MGPKYPQRPHVKDLVPSPLYYYEVDATRKKRQAFVKHAQGGHWDTGPSPSSLFLSAQHQVKSFLCCMYWPWETVQPQRRFDPEAMGWKWRTREFKLVDYLSWLVIVVGTDMATKKVIAFKGIVDVCYLHCSRSIRTKKQKTQTTKNKPKKLPAPKEKENWPHVSYWFRYPWSTSGERTLRRENYTG